MTLTLARRPSPAVAPLLDRDTGPRMTEAEYAERMRALMRAEKRRPGLPPGAPHRPPLPARALRALLDGPATPTQVADRLHTNVATLRPIIAALTAQGLTEVIAAPLPSHPKRTLLALTAAGLARVHP